MNYDFGKVVRKKGKATRISLQKKRNREQVNLLAIPFWPWQHGHGGQRAASEYELDYLHIFQVFWTFQTTQRSSSSIGGGERIWESHWRMTMACRRPYHILQKVITPPTLDFRGKDKKEDIKMKPIDLTAPRAHTWSWDGITHARGTILKTRYNYNLLKDNAQQSFNCCFTSAKV